MRNLNKVLAVATAILALSFGSVAASAGGKHGYRDSRQNTGITAHIIIGNLGPGHIYAMLPYRQPGHYRSVDRRQDYRHYRPHRQFRHHDNYRRHDHFRRHDHRHGGHHGNRRYRR